MVQVLDLENQEQIIIIIPEKKIEAKEVPEKKQEESRLSGYKKYAKYHENLICINKLKSKLDANLYKNKMNLF